MAYHSAEAIHKLNIGMPDNSAFNGLQTSLEQGSVQGYTGNVKKSNVDPSRNGNSPAEVGETTSPFVKPTPVRKEELVKAAKMDKANQTIGKCYYSYIKGGGALNIDNPFLR